MSSASAASPALTFLEALAAAPERAAVTVRATTELGSSGYRCDVGLRRHSIVIDEPTSIGGTNEGPNPLEAYVAALASCQAITYRLWATKLGITLDRVQVEAAGEVDLRGFFGIEDGVRAGYHTITLKVTLDGPEDPARYRELSDRVDEHCPILDQSTRPVTVVRDLFIGGD